MLTSGSRFSMQKPTEPFHSTLHAMPLGDSILCQQHASAYTAEHSLRDIARSSADHILAALNLEGSFQYRHDKRRTLSATGDLLIFDTTRPWQLEIPQGDHKVLAMRIERSSLLPLLNAPTLPTVQKLTDSQFAGLLGGYLRSLAALDAAPSAAEGQALAENFTGLLALALGAREETRQTAGRTGLKAARLCAIRKHVEQKLNDPELTPAMVALHFGITPRYLHILFEETGVSFSRWVQTRRLKKCYDDLTDPACARLNIAEIAYRWGFSDQAHFGRCFRSLYGITPGEARHGRARQEN